MNRLLWLVLALVSAALNPAAALAQDSATLRPVPVALNGTDEAKDSYFACEVGILAGDRTTEQRRASCRQALISEGGSYFHRARIAQILCTNPTGNPAFRIDEHDFATCHDGAIDALASVLTDGLSVHMRLFNALPALCEQGHAQSCVLFARMSISLPKQLKTPLTPADADAMLERACAGKAKDACYWVAKTAFKAQDWTRTRDFLQQECALGDKLICAEVTRLSTRPIESMASASGMHDNEIDKFKERCEREQHRSSCYLVAAYEKDQKESYIATIRAACFTGNASFCEDLARKEAFEGDLGMVDDALYRGCRLDNDLCDDLANYRSGKLIYERSPDLLPPDPQYIAARLVERRAAREVSGKPSAGFLEIMLCDIGDLSACKALGFKVPPDTPSFATPPINEFVSKVLAKADEKCGQKREADFCRELAIVLRPGFKGEQAIDMPRAARFGAAACMLGKADMCAFSGVALVEGQHGGQPDRKNGGALLNKGCSGRDAASCYFFAMTLAQDGRIDQAKLAAQSALEANPAFAEAKDLLAKLNQE